jgi:hypothetical protein
MVKVFLAPRPEHGYARMKLLKHADRTPDRPDRRAYTVDAEKWTRENAAANGTQLPAKRHKEC